MKPFIEAWSSKFQAEKYPLDFYFSRIEGVQDSKTPQEAGNYIIELLHWKDGKVKKVNGEYVLLAAKPNTYSEIKHKGILCSFEFYNWIKKVQSQKSFDINCFKELSQSFNLYGSDSIVIPSFILHVISPIIYPLYDQHVERAKRILLADNLSTNRKLDITSYQEYQMFLQLLINDVYAEPLTIEEIKKVDDALWSFGKWIKEQNKTYKLSLNRKSTHRSNSNVPDNKFKLKVLELVDNKKLTQRGAMETVAAEHKIKLSQSYLDYPGSHIHRWRKQLNNNN
ncbi:hypothetical protein [Fredinandcohnia sp. 179-A 10B2 NHS]|uniref:hypothetical protein n=1 Tax=Fredinandcohnia sp. 179-A 10B2 NHS TaxID=3235176 RepID=UPI0039A1B1EE